MGDNEAADGFLKESYGCGGGGAVTLRLRAQQLFFFFKPT